MKEHPIVFSGPMVRAILKGQKTQTRRMVKPQPEQEPQDVWEVWECKRPNGQVTYGACGVGVGASPDDHTGLWAFSAKGVSVGKPRRCPHGIPGDRLWVRETFFKTIDNEHHDRPGISYAADNEALYLGHWKKRPSIHMPRWACRITLDIKAVRVERLQDISEEDAVAEGASGPMPALVMDDITEVGPMTFIDGFIGLWEDIHDKGAWGLNPWVWVIEFKYPPDRQERER